MFKFDLEHQFEGVSVLGLFIHQKTNFKEYQTGSTAVQHCSNGHLIERKILIFLISDFVTFVQIRFEIPISRSFSLKVVYLSKSRF